jgi:hypothetical protein
MRATWPSWRVTIEDVWSSRVGCGVHPGLVGANVASNWLLAKGRQAPERAMCAPGQVASVAIRNSGRPARQQHAEIAAVLSRFPVLTMPHRGRRDRAVSEAGRRRRLHVRCRCCARNNDSE